MKILNAYAGLGGNRRLWSGHGVVAVEYNDQIADIYKKNFPDDEVVVGDAHQYILDHYMEFDFIWSSPPCQSHSKARMWASKGGRYKPKYPDMTLYQEILFLRHYVDKKWVIENVVPYYDPLISPTQRIGRHLLWSNFNIQGMSLSDTVSPWKITSNTSAYGFDVSGIKISHRKDQLIRNCVHPELGLHVLNQALIPKTQQLSLDI